jgi:pyruvate carboxylase
MDDRHVLSYRLYPKVFKEAFAHHQSFGAVDGLPTKTFFYGLKRGEEIAVELERGKTLYISLSGMSEADERGMRKIFFELNGFPREIEILDQSKISKTKIHPKVDAMNPAHIGAPMPCKVIQVRAKVGTEVKKGEVLLVLEAMKMEYAITAKSDAKVARILVNVGDRVEEGDLLVECPVK